MSESSSACPTRLDSLPLDFLDNPRRQQQGNKQKRNDEMIDIRNLQVMQYKQENASNPALSPCKIQQPHALILSNNIEPFYSILSSHIQCSEGIDNFVQNYVNMQSTIKSLAVDNVSQVVKPVGDVDGRPVMLKSDEHAWWPVNFERLTAMAECLQSTAH